MIKKVGNLEVNDYGEVSTKDSWWIIKMNYNSHSNDAMTLKGIEDVLDLEYILKDIKRKSNGYKSI